MRSLSRPDNLARSFIASAILLALIVCASGCIISGYVAHVYGELPVQAKFLLGVRPTVIVVLDQPDPSGENIEAEVLQLQIEQEIKQHNAGNIIPSTKVSDLRSAKPAEFDRMSTAEIGHAVGAEQVILVGLENSRVTSEDGTGITLKGQIAANIVVIDVPTNHALWPTDSHSGEMVTYATPSVRAREGVTPTEVRRNLEAGLANKIAKLFYTYKPDEE